MHYPVLVPSDVGSELESLEARQRVVDFVMKGATLRTSIRRHRSGGLCELHGILAVSFPTQPRLAICRAPDAPGARL